jgi:hypothetical protein
MSLEATLTTALEADATVTALVGSGALARIFPVRIPQGVALPAVAYQRISTIPNPTLDSAGNLADARLQYTCVASSVDAAHELADVVAAALNQYSGYGGESGGTSGGTVVRIVELENIADRTWDIVPGAERFSVIVEFIATYEV